MFFLNPTCIIFTFQSIFVYYYNYHHSTLFFPQIYMEIKHFLLILPIVYKELSFSSSEFPIFLMQSKWVVILYSLSPNTTASCGATGILEFARNLF